MKFDAKGTFGVQVAFAPDANASFGMEHAFASDVDTCLRGAGSRWHEVRTRAGSRGIASASGAEETRAGKALAASGSERVLRVDVAEVLGSFG